MAEEVWVTADDRVIPIGEMSEAHVRNSLALIVRNLRANKRLQLNERGRVSFVPDRIRLNGMKLSEAVRFFNWFVGKVRQRAEDGGEDGVFQAAKNLRKQGVPIEFALAMLRRSSDGN